MSHPQPQPNPPTTTESTHSILKQELFMNYRGMYTGKKKEKRFKAWAVRQSECTHTTGDVAVNKTPGKLQAPDGDHHKASRPQI